MGETEENMEMNFRGETAEVGLYLAMSKRAEEEGHPDIALYLRQVAMDEAWHAAEFATLLGKIGDTKSNLEKMATGEGGAEKAKANAAEVARKEGNEAAAALFERASRDEARHKAGLKGFLEKL
ncbi:MAG: rubrerythrin family protein [Methanobacteriota archaeon]|nr:MAG: rubrerythrin family protein [Euryarchaeota archaeon]